MELLAVFLLLVNAYVFFMIWRERKKKRTKWRKVEGRYASPHWAKEIVRFLSVLWLLIRGTARVLVWSISLLLSLLLLPLFLLRMFSAPLSGSRSPEETAAYYAMLDEEDRLARQNAKPFWPPDNDWFPD